jgi:cyclase
MLEIRVIPVLLCSDGGLVKTVSFKEPRYVGDPINAVRIFNEKEVDELILLDITATANKRKPDFLRIQDIASECFMPVCYGGGVTDLDEIERIFRLGIEKVAINTAAFSSPSLIQSAAECYGSQSIVVSVDVKQGMFGRYEVHTNGGRQPTGQDPAQYCRRMEQLGAGEILLNSINRDGTMTGYDIDLLRRVSCEVNIPLVACGGAGAISDFTRAIRDGGASAVAAGSMFVFHGRHRAVLITYPEAAELRQIFAEAQKAGESL